MSESFSVAGIASDPAPAYEPVKAMPNGVSKVCAVAKFPALKAHGVALTTSPPPAAVNACTFVTPVLPCALRKYTSTAQPVVRFDAVLLIVRTV